METISNIKHNNDDQILDNKSRHDISDSRYDYDIKLKLSKSNHIVPIINSTALHSLINPVVEAKNTVNSKLNQIIKNEKILIVGLGLGYLATEVINKIKVLDQKKELYIISEDHRLSDICIKKKLIPNYSQLNLINMDQINSYKTNFNFINFLNLNPLIISNNSSLNLNIKSFFEICDQIQISLRLNKTVKRTFKTIKTTKNSTQNSTQKNYKQNYKDFTTGPERYLKHALQSIQ